MIILNLVQPTPVFPGHSTVPGCLWGRSPSSGHRESKLTDANRNDEYFIHTLRKNSQTFKQI